MIQTDFEPYCEDCADLEPVVERLYGDDGVIQQVIACEHILPLSKGGGVLPRERKARIWERRMTDVHCKRLHTEPSLYYGKQRCQKCP